MTTSLELTRKTTVRWRIFLLILLIVAINYVDRASLSVAMPAISKEFGIDAAAQGVILSSFFWTYAFMQIPGGWLADRYRPRLIIATATILWGVFQALAALATGWGMLLLARLGLGVAEGPVFPASGKLNAVWLPARERGRGAVLIDGGAQIFLERPSKFPSHRDLLFNPFFLPTGGTFSDLCVINVLAD